MEEGVWDKCCRFCFSFVGEEWERPLAVKVDQRPEVADSHLMMP